MTIIARFLTVVVLFLTLATVQLAEAPSAAAQDEFNDYYWCGYNVYCDVRVVLNPGEAVEVDYSYISCNQWGCDYWADRLTESCSWWSSQQCVHVLRSYTDSETSVYHVRINVLRHDQRAY